MSKRVEYDGSPVESLPGYETLTTDVARAIADRSQFRGGPGRHVYVNGFDLERVESAGLRDPRITQALIDHGWHTNTDDTTMAVWWFRNGDVTYTKHTITEALVAALAATEETEK